MRKIKYYYTAVEVADFLLISKQTLYNKITENRKHGANHKIPPYVKHGGKTLFPVKDFQKWIDNQKLVFSDRADI
ncbi:MAG: helix-turn-helix domain-containing protein [Shewanella xiamenensis]